MDAFEVYRSPSVKVEPRWTGREAGREDNIDRAPVNDGYRRRSPGKTLVDCSWLIHVIVPSSMFAIFFFKILEIKICFIGHGSIQSFQSLSFSLRLRQPRQSLHRSQEAI